MIKFVVEKGGTGWNVFMQNYQLRQTWHACRPTFESAIIYRDELEQKTREGKIYPGETIDDGQIRVALTRTEIYDLCWESRYEDESIDMVLDKIFGEEKHAES